MITDWKLKATDDGHEYIRVKYDDGEGKMYWAYVDDDCYMKAVKGMKEWGKLVGRRITFGYLSQCNHIFGNNRFELKKYKSAGNKIGYGLLRHWKEYGTLNQGNKERLEKLVRELMD